MAIRKTRWKYDIRTSAALAAAGLVLLIVPQRKPAQLGRVYAAQRAVTESMDASEVQPSQLRALLA